VAKQRPSRGHRSEPKSKPKTKTKGDQANRPRRREGRPTQAERLEALRRARRRRSQLVRFSVAAVAVIVIGGVVAWQVASRRQAQRTIAAMTMGACDYDTRSDPGRVNEHADAVSFKVNPPAGGVHEPSPARAGSYSEEASPPDGQVVHSLEHGYIAISYDPQLAPRDVAALKDIAAAHDEDVLLLPRNDLAVPVAATAWHRRLLCSEVEPASIRKFVQAYVGNGPENVERG
jgi:hypothetical protein